MQKYQDNADWVKNKLYWISKEIQDYLSHNENHISFSTLKTSPFMSRNRYVYTGTVDLQGPETSVLLLSFSNVCLTWSQARF